MVSFIDRIRNSRPAELAYGGKPIAEIPKNWQQRIQTIAEASRADLIDYNAAIKTIQDTAEPGEPGANSVETHDLLQQKQVAHSMLQHANHAIEQRFLAAFADELVACAKAHDLGTFNAATAHLRNDPIAIRHYVVGLLHDTAPKPILPEFNSQVPLPIPPIHTGEASDAGLSIIEKAMQLYTNTQEAAKKTQAASEARHSAFNRFEQATADENTPALTLSDIVNGIWTDATLPRLSGTKEAGFPDIHKLVTQLADEVKLEPKTNWQKTVTSQPDIDITAAPAR